MNETTFPRHALATIAYRGGKTLRDAPEGFGSTVAAPSSRTAVRILAHVGDLFDWMLGLAAGAHHWHDTDSEDWDAQVERVHARLAELDARLATDEPLGMPAAKIFQGPVADALTHIGQLALLRRVAGSPVKGESRISPFASGSTKCGGSSPRARHSDSCRFTGWSRTASDSGDTCCVRSLSRAALALV
jgi:hypothetical protein